MSKVKFESALLLTPGPDTMALLSGIRVPADHRGAPIYPLPEAKLHVTLASIRACKPHKAALSAGIPEMAAPEPQLGETFFAEREGKASFVVAVKNQGEMRAFADALWRSLGIENPEPDRFFHITLGNNSESASTPGLADPFKSVGDVTRADMGTGRVVESLGRGATVWFDMDGVVADFDGGLDRNPELVRAREDLHALIDSSHPSYRGLSDDQIKARLKVEAVEGAPAEMMELKKVFRRYNNLVYATAGRPGFFEGLEVLPGSAEMMRRAAEISGRTPCVVSAPIGDESDPANRCIAEKRRWLEKHLPGLYERAEFTVEKGGVVADPGDVLIDDRPKYCQKFIDAGARAIVHRDPAETMSRLRAMFGVSERKVVGYSEFLSGAR